MKLEWKSYGDQGRTAKGDHGTWRIVTNGAWWFLSVQPTFTRGMLSMDKFTDRRLAMAHAQECEDYGDAPQPIQIEST
jgi:hypothetical protein